MRKRCVLFWTRSRVKRFDCQCRIRGDHVGDSPHYHAADRASRSVSESTRRPNIRSCQRDVRMSVSSDFILFESYGWTRALSAAGRAQCGVRNLSSAPCLAERRSRATRPPTGPRMNGLIYSASVWSRTPRLGNRASITRHGRERQAGLDKPCRAVSASTYGS